ncbi:MAG TPA: NAD(P)H-hydrate dehydratase [Burkholderiaceae bacterium]|nr:NAD(P)H-hydrate dehydratase [Burkholderiaceae bacterium]
MTAEHDSAHAGVIPLNPDTLRNWPLPMPSADGDKEERGRILVIGGSREMPGAVILAAIAALRAGAGKLTIATGASVAQLIALAIPESRVIGLPETDAGGIAQHAIELVAEVAGKLDAALIGPGMQDEEATCAFVHALLPRFGRASVVLDAFAMSAVVGIAKDVAAPVLITPHAGEMAHLCGIDKDAVLADPRHLAQTAAQRWNATVALKGATTLITAPDGRLWQHSGGNIGLAISGSGDTLAGIIAGLAARGAPLEQAGAWGVTLHAHAGKQLAGRVGPLGYLASEIAAEIPQLMYAWST